MIQLVVLLLLFILFFSNGSNISDAKNLENVAQPTIPLFKNTYHNKTRHLQSADETIPSVASAQGSLFILFGLARDDYPWVCKCDPTRLTTILQQRGGDIAPTWDFTRESSIGCSGVVLTGFWSSRIPNCDPSNNTVSMTQSALDPLTNLCHAGKFIPSFAQRAEKAGSEIIIQKCLEYLNNDLKQLVCDDSKFMHLSRLIKSLPQEYPTDYTLRWELVSRLWCLYKISDIYGVKKIRVADALSNQLLYIRAHMIAPCWMKRSAQSSFVPHDEIQRLGKILDWKILLAEVQQRYNREYRFPISTSCARRKNHLSATVYLVSMCRPLWDSNAVGSYLRQELCLDTMDYSHTDVFAKTRLLVLFIGSEYWHSVCATGDLFKWWSPLSCRTSATWDAMFTICFFRAVKYGWATGRPLIATANAIIPTLFQWTAISIGLVQSERKLAFVRDNVPGEYTPLLSRSVSQLKKIAKILVLLLTPTNLPSSALSYYQQQLEKTGNTEDKDSLTCLWDLLESFFGSAFPYSHPSHSGRWSVTLAVFTKSLIIAYIRRVARERMASQVVRPSVGWDNTAQPPLDLRLGRQDDVRFVQMLLPMLLQGTHSKSLNAATAYENGLKQLAFLSPEIVLDPVLDKILPALETVTESHQLPSALRLLAPLLPLILQRCPGVLPQILTLTTPGIDCADPFKTIQVLTFYCVLLSHLACYDLSDLDVDTLPIDAMSKKIKQLLFTNYNAHKDKANSSSSSFLISFHNYPQPDDAVDSINYWSSYKLKERMSALLLTTSTMQAWAVECFELILSVVSSTTTSETDSINNVEQSFATVLQFALISLLSRCSVVIAKELCAQYINWMNAKISPENRRHTVWLTFVFIHARPEICFKPLFDTLYAKLHNFIVGNDLDVPIRSTAESSIIWFLGSFVSLLRSNIYYLREYEAKICQILMWSLGHSNPNIAALGGKGTRRVIESSFCIALRATPKKNVTNKETELDDTHTVTLATESLWSTIAWWVRTDTDCNNNKSAECFNDTFWILPTDEDVAFGNKFVALGFAFVIKHLKLSIPDIFDPSNGTLHALQQEVLAFHPTLLEPFIHSPESLKSQPQHKLLFRALSLSRYLLKGVSCLFPDERPRVCSGIPLISPVENLIVNPLARFVAELCIYVGRTHLGLVVNSDDNDTVELTEALVELRGTEDYVLTRKLLRAIEQVLSRPATAGRLRTLRGDLNRWSALNNWLSVYSGVHATSELQDCGRIVWQERIVHYWESKMENRRLGQKLTGFRKVVMMLAGRLSIHHYAQNRKLAQELLLNASNYHFGSRSKLVKLFVRVLDQETCRLGNLSSSNSEKPSNQNIKLELKTEKSVIHSEETEKVLLSKKAVDMDYQLSPNTSSVRSYGSGSNTLTEPSVAAEDHLYDDNQNSHTSSLELCYAHISGVTFSLNNVAMLRRIWSNAESVSSVLWTLTQAFKAPIEKDSVRSRLVKLAQAILNYRESLPRDERYNTNIVERLLRPLLKDLFNYPNHHWRYQLVATAVLAIFNDIPPALDIEEQYALWLIRACDRQIYYPLLNTLAVFALTLYMHYKMQEGVERLQKNVVLTLHQKQFIHTFVQALVHANHESCSPTSSFETAGQLVVVIIKLDLTWPRKRRAQCSGHLSLHNCLSAQTLVEFQLETAAESNEKILNIFEAWGNELSNLLRQPAGDIESHVTACEIIAGILKAITSTQSRFNSFYKTVWNNTLYSQIFFAYTLFNSEQYPNLLDAICFGLGDPIIEDLVTLFTPLIKFISDPGATPDSNACFTFEEPLKMNLLLESSQSSLEATKRLRLLRTLINLIPVTNFSPHTYENHPIYILTKIFYSSLSILIKHPYDQIRQETAMCIADVLYKNSCCVPEEQQNQQDYNKIWELLIHTAMNLEGFVNSTAKEEMRRTLTDQRPVELCAAETLMLTTIALFRTFEETCGYKQILKMLPLFFGAIEHPDLDTISTITLEYVCSGALGLPNLIVANSKKMSYQIFMQDVITCLERVSLTTSWRVRLACTRLIEIIACRLRLVLQGSPQLNSLVDLSVKNLTDTQTEVRNAARRVLSNLFVSLSPNLCQKYVTEFATLAGPPLKCHLAPRHQVIAGILGLAALIHSAPYHVPDWLPAAITELAKYANAKAADTVKREVQHSLQEFFRTHQDAWIQIHSKKFSELQLEVLETYRGCPVYFS